MPTARYLEHSGGQNNQVNEFLMKDNELLKAKNASLEVVGVVGKVPGYAVRGDQGQNLPVTGLVGYAQQNGATTLYRVINGLYQKWTGSTWQSTPSFPGQYQNVPADPTNNEKVYFEIFMDGLFSVGGPAGNVFLASPSFYWLGSSYLAGSPKGRYIKRWKDNLYVADYLKPSRVDISDVPQNKSGAQPLTWGWDEGTDMVTTAGSPTVTSASAKFKDYNIKPGDLLRLGDTNKVDYYVKSIDSNTQLTLTANVPDSATGQTYEAGSNWFMVGEDDGDVITGFGENSNRLLIFKNFFLYRYDGDEAILVATVGTSAQRSVVTIDQWTLFANRKGIYAYDGVNTKLVSRKMEKWFKGMPDQAYKEMCAWNEGNTYFLFIGNTVVDGKQYYNVLLKYDITQNNYCFEELDDTITVAAPMVEDSTQKYFMGSSDGYVHERNSGLTYNGTVIPFEVESKNMDFGYPEWEKIINRIVVFTKSPGGMMFMVAPDGKRYETTNGILDEIAVFDVKVTGRLFKFQFVHADTNTQPQILGYCIEWEPAGRGK